MIRRDPTGGVVGNGAARHAPRTPCRAAAFCLTDHVVRPPLEQLRLALQQGMEVSCIKPAPFHLGLASTCWTMRMFT